METERRGKKREKGSNSAPGKGSGHSAPRIVIGAKLKELMTQKTEKKVRICTYAI